MTWFVDTNVLVYAITDGPRRPACRSLLRSIAAGDVAATTSTLVLEEFWHLEERLSLGDGAARAALEIFPYVIAVGDWALISAMTTAMPDSLGTADRLHAAVCRSERLDGIISADHAFDLVPGLTRVEPDDEGVASLPMR